MDFSALNEEWKENIRSRFTQQELELAYDYIDFVETDKGLETWIHTNVDKYKLLEFEFLENDILRLVFKNDFLTSNTVDMKLDDFYEIFEKRSLF